MGLFVQSRQAVCDGTGWLLVAFAFSTDLDPLVPRLRCTTSHHQHQDGNNNYQAHDMNLFYAWFNLSAVNEPMHVHPVIYWPGWTQFYTSSRGTCTNSDKLFVSSTKPSLRA